MMIAGIGRRRSRVRGEADLDAFVSGTEARIDVDEAWEAMAAVWNRGELV